MDTVKIGKEKLRLEDQLQKQIEKQKKIRYDLLAADSDMEQTHYLLNKLQRDPEAYFKDYGDQIAELEKTLNTFLNL